jgi:hypothetical protein
MLSYGGLVMRNRKEMPPGWETRLVSEYLGGSRIMVALKLGLKHIPAVVCDFTETLTEGEVLSSKEAILSKFPEPPAVFVMRADGSVYLNHIPFHHMERTYTQGEQRKVRTQVVAECRRIVHRWLIKNDI